MTNSYTNFNKNILNIFCLYLIFILLIFYLNPNFNLEIENLKHWTTYHRDDIAFVYNSLLYSEGIDIHHLDHPSLFTYIFFSWFYKIFYFFGFLNFYDLSGFLNANEEVNLSLSKLFFVSKIVIYFFSFLTIFLFYKILNEITPDKSISFFLTFIFIFSTGFISSSNRLESGLLSLFFVFLSFYFLLRFVKLNKKYELIFLILSFIFLFSAMMQKKMIYFSIPFLFLSLFSVLKKKEIKYFDFKKISFYFLNYKLYLFSLFSIVIFYISYKTIINNNFFLSRDLDFLFLITNYVGLNFLFYLYIRSFQNSFFENILTYNLIFLLTFFFYKIFLIKLLSAPNDIWSISFTNFLGHLNMFGNETIKGAHSFNTINVYLENFLTNIQEVFKIFLFNISYQSILVWLNILLFIILFKKINFNIKISVLVLFIGFFIVQTIILFRYQQDTYFLNTEFLLILSLSLLIFYLKNKKYVLSFCTIIFLSSNFIFIKNVKNVNSMSFCDSSTFKNSNNYESFYDFWTKEIPKELRSKYCLDRVL